jgi:predicted MFS family arabinose efflux permease
MLNASAPTYGLFLVTRASTGIDDSSYPGLHSIISDYFGPQVRGKIYGLLTLAQPLGYLVGMVLALVLGGTIGWRNVFYITGSLGIVLAAVIYFGVKEPKRGQSEPELADLEQMGIYRFNWQAAKELVRKRTILVLWTQGFFGVFPWQVITFWIFRYLEVERGYDDNTILITMSAVILVLASGYFIGGAAGDFAFKRTPRGRLFISIAGVILGALFLAMAILTPLEKQGTFLVWLVLTAIFMPFPAPNMISSVYDITLPEVRSTALAVQLFIENAGAATAPLLAGFVAMRSDLSTAFLLICTIAWGLCAAFYSIGAITVPGDIATLRAELASRAREEASAQAS